HIERCAVLGSGRVGCGFQRRACGMVRVAAEITREGIFGKLRKAEMGFGCRGRILGGGTYATDPKLAGGGILAEVGVHNVDAVLFLCGATDARVTGSRTVLDHGMDIHTEATVEVTTGEMDRVEFSFVVSNLVNTSERIILHFEHASVSFSIFGEPELSVSRHGSRAGFILRDSSDLHPRTSDQIFYAFWSEFIGGIRKGRPSSASAEGAVLTTRIVEQVYAAAEKNNN
ncbi:MAG: Gfo/Idh/MocA family protein, partial [Chthoniobacterales bacterium]